MTSLRDWALQRPGGGPERWVLEELDSLQVHDDPTTDRAGARSRALEILVRRGVLTPATATAADAAPLGGAAGVVPGAAPRPGVSRPVPAVPRGADPGAAIGISAIGFAPLTLLLPLGGFVDLGVAMWIATVVLVAGLIVLLTTGGRGSPAAKRRGRLTSRAMLAVAVAGLATPVATLVAAMLSGRFAPEFTGACLAYQSMAVFLLFGGSAIVRRQERGR